MEVAEINRKFLTNGNVLIYETKCQDDFRVAEVRHNQRSNLYTIWFNGCYIHGCKSVKSLKDRLAKLIADWELKFIRIDKN